MKKTLLFGAGQAGAMIARLLAGDCESVCFADNSPEKWGTSLAGLPVMKPEDALRTDPACVCLCVLDGERAAQMEAQLRALGYGGEIIRPDALRRFDARAATMRLLAGQIARLGVPGDLAELGVYRGDFAALMNAALPERRLHLFDTFTGFPERDVAVERAGGFSRAGSGDFGGTSRETVAARLPHPERALFHEGYFPETFGTCADCRFALVSIDADLYAPTAAALPLFWERLSPGGALLIHDVSSTQFSGAGRAVEEFCSARGLLPMPVCDLHGSAVLRRGL